MTFKGTEFEGALFFATTEVINSHVHENTNTKANRKVIVSIDELKLLLN